ncbi:MAG: hypothetical protein H7Y37_11500 [Anaerolineae bacterium]|nr:hypothetical protein [Gloeobacterales cyanobacterium ES-bin-313]
MQTQLSTRTTKGNSRPKRSPHLPSKNYHRVLIPDGDGIVVALPDHPLAYRAIAVVPGNYHQAERAAAFQINQDKAHLP